MNVTTSTPTHQSNDNASPPAKALTSLVCIDRGTPIQDRKGIKLGLANVGSRLSTRDQRRPWRSGGQVSNWPDPAREQHQKSCDG